MFDTRPVCSTEAASLLRGAGFEKPYPAWAIRIADCGAKPRERMLTLRRCAQDIDTKLWVSALISVLNDKDEQTRTVADIAQDSASTIRCRCGQKFTSAALWRAHEAVCEG